MRQVTAVSSGSIKNWSCTQGKSCWASGHRRKVPYEKFNLTGDGARARLPFLLSSSTSRPCACSRRELAVLPVKVSGFLWVCVQNAVYWLSIYVRAGLSSYVHVGCCAVQTELLRLDSVPPEIAPAAGQAASRKPCFIPRTGGTKEVKDELLILRGRAKVTSTGFCMFLMLPGYDVPTSLWIRRTYISNLLPDLLL